MVVTMLGDYQNNATVHTKHKFLFDALSKRYEILEIFDAGLRGKDRLLNAISVFDTDRNRWRTHYYKNPSAFRKRSARASTFLESWSDRADVALQIGALFDSTVPNKTVPNVIYSDYTSTLSSRRPDAGRSPMEGQELMDWIASETAALQHAAHICTRSRFVKNSLLEDYQIPPERVTVVGGGVNFEAMPSLLKKPPHREPVTLFVGKEFYRKGGDLVLQAFQLVTRKRPTARLILVTTDVLPLDLPLQNVTVIKEEVSRERMSELYRNSDLFVLPSRLETWGDVLLEAMAHGLPCIGVQSDAMEEIIENGKTGFVVSAGDVRAIADHMLTLLKNADLRNSMSEAARKRVKTEFLWEHVIDRMAPVLKAAAQQRASLHNA